MWHPRHQQSRRPGVAAERVVHGARSRPDRLGPVAPARRELPLREHEVEHPVEQVVLVRDVAVEGHRLEAELVTEPAHRQRLDARAVGELERHAQDAVAAEWDPRLLGHGLTSLRRTRILHRKLTM